MRSPTRRCSPISLAGSRAKTTGAREASRTRNVVGCTRFVKLARQHPVAAADWLRGVAGPDLVILIHEGEESAARCAVARVADSFDKLRTGSS